MREFFLVAAMRKGGGLAAPTSTLNTKYAYGANFRGF